MKKAKTIVLVVLASIMFAGCGEKTDSSSPKAIAEKAFKAALKLDFETLRKHIAQNKLASIEEAEKMFEDIEKRDDFIKGAKGIKIKALSEEFSEDEQFAKVTVQIKLLSRKEPHEQELNFIKENGEWKMDENPF